MLVHTPEILIWRFERATNYKTSVSHYTIAGFRGQKETLYIPEESAKGGILVTKSAIEVSWLQETAEAAVDEICRVRATG